MIAEWSLFEPLLVLIKNTHLGWTKGKLESTKWSWTWQLLCYCPRPDINWACSSSCKLLWVGYIEVLLWYCWFSFLFADFSDVKTAKIHFINSCYIWINERIYSTSRGILVRQLPGYLLLVTDKHHEAENVFNSPLKVNQSPGGSL